MPRRPLASLPLHHIDTAILLGPLASEESRTCMRYLQRVGYNHRGHLSLPVLGELSLALLRMTDYNKRQDLVEWLARTIRLRSIDEFVPSKLTAALSKVQEVGTRLDPVDRQIVACAVEARAHTLVTLDQKLLSSVDLENKFGLNISHPAELI